MALNVTMDTRSVTNGYSVLENNVCQLQLFKLSYSKKCAVYYVEICTVMFVKTIYGSVELCSIYVDLNFGMTSTGIQCMYNHNYKCLDQAHLSKPQPHSAALPVMGLWTASTTSSSYYKIYMF